MSAHGLHDFVEEIKYHYVGKPMLHKKAPAQLRKSISEFHAKTLRKRSRVTYTSRDLANMDQTMLQFVLDDNKTYDKKEAGQVWIASGQSGLEKRQCIIQLAMFADDKILPSLTIFPGQGLRINAANKKKVINALSLFFSLKLGVK